MEQGFCYFCTMGFKAFLSSKHDYVINSLMTLSWKKVYYNTSKQIPLVVSGILHKLVARETERRNESAKGPF